ncbi:MAG: TRM11 family SAM-dependent methyltransferase [Anaerolineales bacterium]
MLSSTQAPHKEKLAAICTRMPNNALVAAECASLTGGVPDIDGFAFCQRVEHIPQSAYVRMGLRILASSPTLDDLIEVVAQTDFSADEFRIEFCSLSPENRIHPRQSILALANAIPFYPNLNHPKHRFLLVERQENLWLGEILSECEHSYQIHATKPYNISSSLSSRISRALVNLVIPQAHSLLDPCCGTGSILLEAQALGIQAYGGDLNKRMVGMTRKNLAHFDYAAKVEQADARTCQQKADALVTNLPYGRFLDANETVIRAILENGRKLAPVAIYVTEYDLTDWLVAAGYRNVAIYPVAKHDNFVRYVHLARRPE